MTGPALDELLRRLVASQVRFVLVGGLAVNAWGVVRGTKDVDIVADSDTDNLRRLADTAADVGGHVHRAEMLISSARGLAALLLEGDRVLIDTPIGSIDVIQGLPGVPTYEHLRRNALEVEILDVRVPVCSLEDLRAMKGEAGRTRDLADLEDLDVAHGEP